MELTRSQKRDLGIKEIAKLVRNQLKSEFPDCKFSVTKESYSGGCSMTVALMSAPFEPFTEKGKTSSTRSVNTYHIQESEYFTDDTKRVMSRALEISNEYNYDNSDSQSDYFDVNFYLHLAIGKWDRPFIKMEKT